MLGGVQPLTVETARHLAQGLFSATQTKQLDALVRAGLRNPVKVSVKVEVCICGCSSSTLWFAHPMATVKHTAPARVPGPASPVPAPLQGGASAQCREQVTPTSLHIECMLCPAEDRLNQLVNVLQSGEEPSSESELSDDGGETGGQLDANEPRKALVFFATCACVDYFSKILSGLPQLAGRNILSLHGKMVTKVGGRGRFCIGALRGDVASEPFGCTQLARSHSGCRE